MPSTLVAQRRAKTFLCCCLSSEYRIVFPRSHIYAHTRAHARKHAQKPVAGVTEGKATALCAAGGEVLRACLSVRKSAEDVEGG